MNDRRIPNLKPLDEHWVSQLVSELRNVMEMPQSGERIHGREKIREFQEAYPNT
jgi:hypothetical protein